MSVSSSVSDVLKFPIDVVWGVCRAPFAELEVGSTLTLMGAQHVLTAFDEAGHSLAHVWSDKNSTHTLKLREVTEDNTTVMEIGMETGEGSDTTKEACTEHVSHVLEYLIKMVKRTYWTANRVRDTFVNFFKDKKDHKNIHSSSVVPHSDPTLLFANAGMNQYKPIFLGQVVPGTWMDGLKRACNSQKCIRAGGKHNDLDDVGKDVYHHTFFEMLGNWSFGDYFKKEAIAWAWELLTEVYNLDPARLYATYFGGDEAMGVPADDDAKEIWLQFLPESHVLPFDKKDNFWEMGATGPCGPCTELHYDRIGNREVPELVNMDDPDVLEIWNIVFIQFNRLPDSSLDPLPAKSIDTGMGFERITSVLQDLSSNYDSDIFTTIISRIEALRGEGVPTYQGRVGKEDTGNVDMAYRVLADHVRTLTFAITDGAVPGKNGRNYVLRRILRRAVRYGEQILRCKPGFFTTLVPVVNEVFGNAFPELGPRVKYVQEIIADEEKAFGRTLARGVKLFNRHMVKLEKEGVKEFPGAVAFQLYDTYGFPYDLTELMAEERGLSMDEAGYNATMQEQIDRSRASRTEGKVDLNLQQEQTLFLSTSGVEPTVDDTKYDWHHVHATKVRAIFAPGEGGRVKTLEGATASDVVIGLVMDSTSFYAEAGGQIFDVGSIVDRVPEEALAEAGTTGAELNLVVNDAKVRFRVHKVVKFAGFILHVGLLEAGSIDVGNDVSCIVDYDRRSRIAPNHTMTHMLNWALRKVLRQDCDQQGSSNDDTRLRFDFAYPKNIPTAQLLEIEKEVNVTIERGLEVHTKSVPYAEAKKLTTTLRCMFNETYPPVVRVISVGMPLDPMLADPTSQEWADFSVELCGGTHLTNTANARRFAIVEEGSVSKGTRRIVALTGAAALEAFTNAAIVEATITEAQGLKGDAAIKATISKAKQQLLSLTLPLAAKRQMNDTLDKMEHQRMANAKANAAQALDSAIEQAAAASESKRVVVVAEVGAAKTVIKQLKSLTSKHSCSVCLVTSDKNAVVCFVSVIKAHVAAGHSAADWVKHVADALGAKAGGKKDFAQAKFKGIKDNTDIIAAAQAFLEQ